MPPSRPQTASSESLSSWIRRSLDDDPIDAFTLPGGRAEPRGPGLLELIPDAPAVEAPAGVISVGIHGNETAPIELLQRCLKALGAGETSVGAPTLLVLGSLEAIRRDVRFIDTNLNRLFRRDLEETGAEPERARTLMGAIDAFFARYPGRARLHYDLHTAIRDSRYPRFAVEPYADAVTPPQHWAWLAAADIQAVLHQHRHSWTFSHYTKHYHGAAAFTLELGRARPFGHNDLAPLAPMGRLLLALLAGQPPRRSDPQRMTFLRVEHELMRRSEAFRLAFADDIPNFTEFAPGSLLAEDGEHGATHVGEVPLAVVFPNANVELGARAALLARPVAPPA
ncbi:succinylglutamate desuccinylase [Halomonas sp. H10-9-1]|uniref:succinylglutamate desuccinylase n=1 Tax=Halomonas sp. H10-9-1 TaxID=2950871 RepID=UPI0032DFD140